jgi:hypothetical protein
MREQGLTVCGARQAGCDLGGEMAGGGTVTTTSRSRTRTATAGAAAP